MHSLVGKTGFAVSAAALLVVNKLAVYEIPLPSSICTLQLAWTATFVFVLNRASIVEIRPAQLTTVLKYMPWVFAFVATMYTSMMTLYAADIETVIVFRCLSPIIISFLEWFWFDRELPEMQSWMAMGVMVGAAISYAWFDKVLRIRGIYAYAWVMTHVVCDVMSTLLGRHLVTTATKLPTWDHVLHANLLSLPPMLVAGLAGGEHTALRHIQWTVEGLSWVSLSCILAVGISYFSWWARAEMSASAFSMLSIGTKIGSSALNCLIWEKHASAGGLGALVVCVLASAAYRSPPRRDGSKIAKGSSSEGSTKGMQGGCHEITKHLLSRTHSAMGAILLVTLLAVMTGSSQRSTSAIRASIHDATGEPREHIHRQLVYSPDLGYDIEWKGSFVSEFERRKREAAKVRAGSVRFPLASDTLEAAEVLAAANVILSVNLTMGARVKAFERQLEAYLGVPCAVMVNSGSSANLVAVAGALELANMGTLQTFGTRGLSPGDEVLVPALAWSTTLAPLVQFGLQPILVDVKPHTLNMDVASMVEAITSKTRAIMLVHALGNSPDMDALMELATKHRLVVIEDTCESLGSRHRGTLLGTQGHFGAYSFYYSHHITSGEGGAVVSSIRDDGTVCETLRSVRAHGWTREFSPKRKALIEAAHKDVDPRFLFVHWGFNVRPMEIQAAIASIQLTRLETLNRNRRANFYTMKAALASHEEILALPQASDGVDPAWFGLVLMLSAPYAHQRANLFEHLARKGIETRPVISGNFARQPVCTTASATWRGCGIGSKAFPGADVIHNQGLYIGLPSLSLLTPAEVKELKQAILSFPFAPRHVTLVTGASGLVGFALRSLLADHHQAGKGHGAFVFANHSHADLRDARATRELLFDLRPTRIIHLAAKIAPTAVMHKANTEYYIDNVKINTNLLRSAADLVTSKLLGIGSGSNSIAMLKVVSCLSTVMFSAAGGTSSTAHAGAVAPHAAGYAAAKSQQLQLSSWLSEETPGLRAVTVLASNVFGPNARCEPSGPLLNALIAKAIAAVHNGTPLVVAGSGEPRRQMVFSLDLAKVLLWASEHYTDANVPLTVAGEEHKVQELASMAAVVVGFHGRITNDLSSADGPLRRAVALSDRLHELMPGFSLTSIARAINVTAKACKAAARASRHGGADLPLSLAPMARGGADAAHWKPKQSGHKRPGH